MSYCSREQEEFKSIMWGREEWWEGEGRLSHHQPSDHQQLHNKDGRQFITNFKLQFQLINKRKKSKYLYLLK
jgi:hypothetical protein